MTRYDMSAHAYYRILKVATIPKLDSITDMQVIQICKSSDYRNLDRGVWGRTI